MIFKSTESFIIVFSLLLFTPVTVMSGLKMFDVISMNWWIVFSPLIALLILDVLFLLSVCLFKAVQLLSKFSKRIA